MFKTFVPLISGHAL